MESNVGPEQRIALKVRFSVVMPVYNRVKYVRQAIDSVLSQTFTDYELIVVDDGSTDGSAEVLQSYGNRIKVIRQPNQGPEVARNTGAALAQGEYLVFLDSDDFFFPSVLAIYDRIIRSFDSPPVIFGKEFHYQDAQPLPAAPLDSCPVQVLTYRDYLSKTVPVMCIQSKLALLKSVFDEVGGHRNSTSRTWYGDSVDLLLKIATYGPCIIIQEPCTFARRKHEENSIWQVGPHAGGILSVARLERQAQYPGGNQRRWDRYALIGGVASTWALQYCWRRKQRALAFRLLFGTAPMVLAAVLKKSLRYFRKPPQPIVLPQELSRPVR